MSAEAKRGESLQPNFEFFVGDTIERFSRKTTREDSKPYLIQDAVRDSILESGISAIDVVSTLMQQTTLAPKEVGEIIVDRDYNGTWEDFCVELSRGIIYHEISQRNPEIADEDFRRSDE